MEMNEYVGVIAGAAFVGMAIIWYLYPEKMLRIAPYLPGFMMPVISAKVENEQDDEVQ